MDQMKSTMTGWLTVPKTKAQIEQNKAIAQAARKQGKKIVGKKSSSNSITKAFAVAAAKENLSNGQRKGSKKKIITKKTKRKSYSSDEEESEEEDEEPGFQSESESEASFVEDDEESEEDDNVSYAEEDDDDDDDDSEPDQVNEVPSDSDDEELLSPSPTPNKKKNKNRKKQQEQQSRKNTITLDDDSNSDSDSDSDTGLLSGANYKPRPSKPSAALQRATQAAKNRFNQPISFSNSSTKPKASAVPPKVKKVSPPSSDSAAAVKKTKSNKKKNYSDSDSSDDSLLQTPPFRKKSSKFFDKKKKTMTTTTTTSNQPAVSKTTTASTKRPAHFEIDSSSGSSDDDDDDDDVVPLPKRQRSSMDSLGSLNSTNNNNNKTKATNDKDMEEDPEDSWMADSPDPMEYSFRKKLSKKKNQKKKKKISKKSNPFAQFANQDDSDDDDEDEQLAMAMAMSESMKDHAKGSSATAATVQSKKKKKIIKKTIIDISDDEDEPIFKEDDELEDSDEDDNEDDVNDEGYDEEKEAATNVLQTAEGLSARVLQTMKTWMSSTKDEHAEDAHKGMIIEDGALALGGSDINDDEDNNKNSKEWISQEYMKQVLPQVTLSKYQLIGVNWMALLHTMECKIGHHANNKSSSKTTNVNGILADEMGLGKTVQTIAFLAYLRDQRLHHGDKKERGNNMPHLIVVPVSVLPNWVREFEKFAPDMNVVKYHGSLAEREELQDHLRQYLPKKDTQQVRNKKWSKQLQSPDNDDGDGEDYEDQLDVILAPVTYFQKEKSDDRRFLNKFKFDYLVVDEAHMLKNAQSTRYKMLDRIGTQHRLLLTGTPVQNSPQELLNMLCFIMPLFSQGGSSGGYKDNEDGNNASVSERMLQHFVEHETMEEGANEEKAYQKLKRLFAPFVLRRKKSDVIAQLLPPKQRVVEYVELDMEARSVYEGILAAHVNKNGTKLSAAIGDHLFTNLRKAAHHPLLLRTRHTSNSEVNHMTEHFHKYGAFKGEGSTRARVKEELSKFNDFHIHLTALDLIDENPRRRPSLERYILPERALFSSAKFSRLQKLLPSLITDGHRILIFSVWTSCLDLLGCLMEHLDLKYLRMDGSCPSSERQELIDRFNQDPSISVFLLSTKACGLGINLTAADTCIIHDLDFNPFNDLQAEDRCHRIGQKKKVTVYKMVTKETVDADIYTMQERKAKMNAAIMESKNDKKERREMLNQEIQRFLGSPKAEKSTKKIDEVEFV